MILWLPFLIYIPFLFRWLISQGYDLSCVFQSSVFLQHRHDHFFLPVWIWGDFMSAMLRGYMVTLCHIEIQVFFLYLIHIPGFYGEMLYSLEGPNLVTMIHCTVKCEPVAVEICRPFCQFLDWFAFILVLCFFSRYEIAAEKPSSSLPNPRSYPGLLLWSMWCCVISAVHRIHLEKKCWMNLWTTPIVLMTELSLP